MLQLRLRKLLRLGISICFEKENINTLEMESEIFITIHGAFSQSESESISKSVGWGKQQAMREGRTSIQYKRLYAYRRGTDDKPEIIPAEAGVVRDIYRQYLAWASVRMIRESLEANQNEGIVDRKAFDAVQAEMARRNAGRSPSKKNAPTGRSCYASKYALSGRLVCGECGTLYRRCVWVKRGKCRVVWRCVSRLDYGAKYCHSSPTLDEEPLQRAILAAISKAMTGREELARQIAGAVEMELTPVPGQAISLADIDRRLEELEGQFNTLLERAAEKPGDLDYLEQFQSITNEISALKEQRGQIKEQRRTDAAAMQRADMAVSLLEHTSPVLTE